MTATRRGQAEPASSGEASAFRRRLLDGLAESIAAVGYRNTTVADIVRRARTSRRTFYEHFASREACLLALVADSTAQTIGQIVAAVDPTRPWEHQVRQAIEAWITRVESEPELIVSWIRDVPTLGDVARQLQHDTMEAFITMVRTLADTDEWRAAHGDPPSREMAIILLGGLRELIASTVENGGRVRDITETAVRAAIVLGRASAL
ncbi:TetR/AcrR family transcriptional regulator [Actinokineospora iranica]|uniref:TetR/AcrR family transcriptional regulator n=1 Tax=Actinokineospora iranica TaxID=1271860 RepID=UPI001E2DC614|nr:TetR/AcrR family transcriptional regulator [Actinokineospora iranica]